MSTKRLQLEEAFDIIKQRRSLISPNFSFMGQLQQFESEVLSSTPITAATTPETSIEPATYCVDRLYGIFHSSWEKSLKFRLQSLFEL
uniref:protein-tyrosine-phosphatase n=1 Tax=Salmo trutta TaxID=8032 RepID=A0A674E9E1_SALTR